VTVVSRWILDAQVAVDRFDFSALASVRPTTVPLYASMFSNVWLSTPRCSAVGLAAFVGIGQNVFPIHLVLQRMETTVGRFLRFCVQRRLQLLNTEWSC